MVRGLLQSLIVFACICLGDAKHSSQTAQTALKAVVNLQSQPVSSHLVFQHRHFFNYDLRKSLTDHDGDDSSAIELKALEDLSSVHAHTQGLPRTRLSLSASLAGGSRSEHVFEDSSLHSIPPNVSDKLTVVNLAKMTSDAYLFDPREPDWLNTSLGFNFTSQFGWDSDGLRGHIFSTEDNSTVVVAFKGTTIDPRSKFRHNDRLNDNRLFSCCCGTNNPYFYPAVCNCKIGPWECNSACLTESVLEKDMYYNAAMTLMHKFQSMFPNSTFWTVGHSLGGALASLVAMTLDIPAVTYEAPPERLAAERMGLTVPGARVVHHFGNTADPIFDGTCNGYTSLCSFWGFNFESQCFTGLTHTYDTIKDKGWHSNIANHRINVVIENVLEAYDEVPVGVRKECVDCERWNFTSYGTR